VDKGRNSSSVSTLKDVARLAGVSVPTASQALNGRARINTATRERVRAAARRLRYTANAAARRLSLGRSDSVAIVPGKNMSGVFSDLFYRAVLTGVGGVFEEAGYRMVITPISRSVAHTPQFVTMAGARELDGMLVVGVVGTRWILDVMDAGVPVVLLDNHVPDIPVHCVINDNASGAYCAVRYLASLGHTRIAFLGAAVEYPFGRETREGYLRALGDSGLAADPTLEIAVPIDVESACQGAAVLLSLKRPPSALFTATDMMALGAMRAARQHGIDIPTGLSVVGMDDIELASVTDPPLTTVRVHKEDMGRRAAQMLLALIRGIDVDPKTVVLSSDLVIRGTTGAPDSESPQTR
jgi:DNA-binding LacI/PurR family transcriptional regulator